MTGWVTGEHAASAVTDRLGDMPRAVTDRLGDMPRAVTDRLGDMPRAVTNRLGDMPRAVTDRLGDMPRAVTAAGSPMTRLGDDGVAAQDGGAVLGQARHGQADERPLLQQARPVQVEGPDVRLRAWV